MDFYGLIGHPLGHSFSKRFFTEKFERESICAAYLNFDIPDVATLPDLVNHYPTLRGLNVTIPHKQAVIPLLTGGLSREAREIGAVNVIRIIRRSPTDIPLLEGHNADYIGFQRSLEPLLADGQTHTSALVLGTGGASRAICYALRRLHIEPTLVSRHAPYLTYDDVTPDVIRRHTVIVNCTPLGMHPHPDDCPPIPYEALTPHHILYDLVYNPEDTLFMKRGRAQGATVKNGLEMLHLQALASWHIWQQSSD